MGDFSPNPGSRAGHGNGSSWWSRALDIAFGSTVGGVLVRKVFGWESLPVGSINTVLTVGSLSNVGWASTATTGITELTGDVTTTAGTGVKAATLATVNSSPGSYTIASLTVNGKGLVTAASSGSIASTNLSDYAAGVWSPQDASGAGLALTFAGQSYVKIGSLLLLALNVTYPSTTSSANAQINNFPFTVTSPAQVLVLSGGFGVGVPTYAQVRTGTQSIYFSDETGNFLTNQQVYTNQPGSLAMVFIVSL